MTPEEYWLHITEIAIQAIAVVITTIAAVIAIYQIRQLRLTIRLAHQANIIDAVSHCTTRYATIMAEIPDASAGEETIRGWWYRYCDLQTEQFTYFRKGILDRDIYEMWMQELGQVYQSPPNNISALGTREMEHSKYLASHLPHYRKLREFFQRMAATSKMENKERVAALHEMIEQFGPKVRTMI